MISTIIYFLQIFCVEDFVSGCEVRYFGRGHCRFLVRLIEGRKSGRRFFRRMFQFVLRQVSSPLITQPPPASLSLIFTFLMLMQSNSNKTCCPVAVSFLVMQKQYLKHKF